MCRLLDRSMREGEFLVLIVDNQLLIRIPTDWRDFAVVLLLRPPREQAAVLM